MLDRNARSKTNPALRMLLAGAVLATCASFVAADDTPAPPANTPPDGFVALFNGTDLTGWKGLVADPPKRAKMTAEELAEAQQKADEQIRQHWRVEDGQIVIDNPHRKWRRYDFATKGKPSELATRRWEQIQTNLA